MCKCNNYLFEMCLSILSDLKYEYHTPDIKDWRGTTEVHFSDGSVFEFISFINSVAKRGWNGTIAHDPHRLLWGVKFDTDQSFVVWMSLGMLKAFYECVKVPNVKEEIQKVMNLPLDTSWKSNLTPHINQWNERNEEREY
jgi:hypothetical protein